MSMVQAFSYNFSTVENPLSDGGNFATINDTVFTNSPLQVIAGNLCEPTTTAAPGATMFRGIVAAPSGVLPNDQYGEVTLTTWGAVAADNFYLLVRCTNPTTATYYLFSAGYTGYYLFAIVAGTSHTLINYTLYSGGNPAQGDKFRLSVTGNALTVTSTGATSTINFTDTNNYVPSGGYAGFALYDSSVITGVQTGLFAFGANQCATPTFSPVAGSYTGTQTVAITSATGGCTIYYTTNGTTPTESSSSISNGGTVSVASSLTLKAIASLTNNLDSAVGSAAYVINSGPASAGSSNFGFVFKLGF